MKIKSLALLFATSTDILCSENARADVARGQALSRQWCASCHAVEPGAAVPNPAAPTFESVAAEPSSTAYSLSVFMRTPHPTMPNFIITSSDIGDIVEYIMSLKPRR
jgi:cytochrome c